MSPFEYFALSIGIAIVAELRIARGERRQTALYVAASVFAAGALLALLGTTR